MNALPLPGDGPERLLQHADALRRLARRLVRDDAEADDLVQETWTSVLEKPRDQEPAAGWKRWLFGVARNLARERRRSEGRRARREQTAARPEATSAGSEIVEQLETFRVLADELSRLEEPYRSTLYRRYFEGHTNERIAADDKIAEPSVRSRISRGLALLRERLERRESDGRGGWIALLRRIAYEEPRLAPRFGLPFLVLSGAIAVVSTVIVVALVQTHGSKRDASGQTALVPRTDRDAAHQTALVDARAEDSVGSTRVTMIPASAAEQPSLHLVDLRTREPLAGYELRVGVLGVGAAAGESRTSRADGSVDLPLAHGTFDLALTLIDHPSLDALRRAHSGGRSFAWTIPAVHFAPGAEACTLGIAVGPRFEIRFEPPLTVPIETLHAEIFSSDRGSMRASSTAPLRAPLEENGSCWVRFLDEATYLGGAPPFHLRVCDDSGLLCGDAEVIRIVGKELEPVVINLQPRGALKVRVLGEDGRACPARLTLSVAGRAPVRAASDVGDVQFRWIPAEAVELRVEADDLEPILVPARVIAGQTMSQNITVRRDPGAGSLSGRALSSAPSVRFEIENEATHERREMAGSFSAGVAAFEFTHVSPGPWILRAHAPGIWRWNPAELHVTAPASDLVLTPLAVTNVRAIKFRAFDEQTGDRIDHFDARVQCDGADGEVQTRTTGFGNLVFESVPTDAPVTWSVHAEGYRPARGDRTTLERPGEMDLVRVKLVRGWQRDVEVRDATTRVPLAGARVIVDGEALGLTDARGVLGIDRATPPHRIVVELEGWIVSGGSIGPDGEWSSDTPFSVLALLRRR